MALRLPESESVLSFDSGPFTRAELSIQTTFNTLIRKLEERRDRLLSEVHEMRDSYLSAEGVRVKHIRDLDRLIRRIKEASIEENLIVKKQEEQIRKLEVEKKEFQLTTPIPVPQFVSASLEELQHRIEMFGSLRDIALPYNKKRHPIRSIGKEGKGKAEFSYPYGVELDGRGNIFVADSDNHIISLFSLEGQFIKEFGKGELSRPHSMSLYKEWLFVTDYHQNKVLKYTIQKYKLVCKSELGLDLPLGLTVDDDEVFVADYHNHRIVVVSLDLKYIRELGNDKLIYPRDVKVRMDKVFVANKSKFHNIDVLSKSGDLLNSFINLKNVSGPLFICFDKFHNILVSDWSGRIIRIYTFEGDYVHSIECDFRPEGITVTQDNVIICSDYTNDKIKLF